jgi:tetratricopeptide (TPR) repeat protein
MEKIDLNTDHSQEDEDFDDEEEKNFMEFNEEVDNGRKLVKEDPASAPYCCELAYALFERNKSGDIEEAIQVYHKALDLEPNYPRAVNGLADALRRSGKYEESVSVYLNGITLNPEYFNYYDGLGKAYKKLGRKEEALVAYNKYIELADPKITPFSIERAKRKAEKIEKKIFEEKEPTPATKK